ncbi:hypothetical protein [Rhizobium skierniewicense]
MRSLKQVGFRQPQSCGSGGWTIESS